MKHQTNPAIAVNRMYTVLNNAVMDFRVVMIERTFYSDRFKKNSETEEIPVAIGHLSRDYGYNGYKPILKGTPIFRIKDFDYFEMELISSGAIHRQKFYKGTLDNHTTKKIISHETRSRTENWDL